MRTGITALVGALVLLGGCGWTGQAPEHGRDLYVRHCASCHGAAGRGDGPAAAALAPRPTDLTRTREDLPGLMRVIDGRRTIRAHGASDMPVWGCVFEAALEGEPRQHRHALRNVQVLAEYVLHLRAEAAREPSAAPAP
jgi:hypothetical protein